ncbi:MAG: glucose-6-phosphate isomerase [Flavobacteriaceae bacterium]
MPLPKINPTTTAAWAQLQKQFEADKEKTILQHFDNETDRLEAFTLQWEDFYVDLSKNRLSQTTKDTLIDLANACQLDTAISAYFEGEKINETENRAVLHTALRAVPNTTVKLDGVAIADEINVVKKQMRTFTQKVIAGQWKGHTGKPIDTVVNIGIGGSDLGPAMVTEALEYYRNHLNIHFVSNVEGDHVQEVIKKIDPETTLFVIVSKTFTTQETISNATTLRRWFVDQASEEAIKAHFVAVSTNVEAIEAFGIDANNVFAMNDWVGGRFSLWSAVGLSICLAIGPDAFEELLAGAGAMDSHFRTTPFGQNIPVMMALISLWYNNFWGAESEAIIPYTQYLRSLPAYLQQGIMESNGKYVDRDGKPVNYQTGTLIWGASGTNAQHAFFQLMHQGTKLIPADFIGFKKSLYNAQEHQDKLMANFIAQTEAFMVGKTLPTVLSELAAQGLGGPARERLAPFKVFEGNRPTNTLLIEALTPYNLGALIALYEQKIFVQGVLWNIFSYDQWGVELGKQLANKLLTDFLDLQKAAKSHDPSTVALLKKYKQ